jgi:hypothetical protein
MGVIIILAVPKINDYPRVKFLDDERVADIFEKWEESVEDFEGMT